MAWVNAVDSSYDLLTEEEAHRLKAAGVELYIQALSALPPSGLEQPASRVISLRSATYAGLKIAGYALISGQQGAQTEIAYALGGVPQDLLDQLEFCAVDVEVSGVGVSDVADACNYVLGRLPGKPIVVYTSYNQWRSVMGNPPHPEGALLWDANWDNDPNPSRIYTRRYGGWEADDVLLKQYTGGSSVEGQHVDRNIWRVPDPIPAPEPPPPQTQLDRIEAKIDQLLAR